MRTLKKLIPLLALGAASLVFVGVSAALEGEDAPSLDEPTTIPAPDCTDDTAVAETEDTEPGATEPDGDDPCAGTTDSTMPEVDEVTEPEVDEGTEPAVDDDIEAPDAGEAPVNHGAAVSEAAHTCPPGPEHGKCVSEVARSDAGKPPHAATEDEGDDTTVDGDEPEEGDAAGAPAEPREGKGGQGKGRGRG